MVDKAIAQFDALEFCKDESEYNALSRCDKASMAADLLVAKHAIQSGVVNESSYRSLNVVGHLLMQANLDAADAKDMKKSESIGPVIDEVMDAMAAYEAKKTVSKRIA